MPTKFSEKRRTDGVQSDDTLFLFLGSDGARYKYINDGSNEKIWIEMSWK